MALTWCQGQIVKKIVWTEGLFTLHVAVDGVKPFEPGQFLQLGHTRGDQHVHRPYSVASPWGEVLEFFIVLVEEGALTPHLWSLETGDSVDVSERAAGSFTLKKAPEAENLWLISTGTGLAPYIAMLRKQEIWDRYKRIVLVHGVRVAADLAYEQELEGWCASHPERFRYVPALTREQCDGILYGRIPACLRDGSLEEAAGVQITPEASALLLCGNPAMLDDMEEALGERGLKRHRSKAPGQIVLERYW